MKNLIKNSIDTISKMSSLQRNTLLCKLSTKEHLGIIEPDEIIQLSTIQAIRMANGEIDRVLKNWQENPELDPRKQ